MSARTLVFGLEAADPTQLERLMAEGRLPVLASLADAGVRVAIENVEGFSAGAFWPSLFTGLDPAGHGRYSITQMAAGSYEMVRRPDDDLRAPPLWQLLDDEGHVCCAIDVHRCPLTPMSRGAVICDWMGHHPNSPPRSSPAGLVEELTAAVGPDPYAAFMAECYETHGPSWFVEHRYTPDAAAFVNALGARIEAKTRAASSLLAQRHWDLFLVNFAEAHDVGHLFDMAHSAVAETYQRLDAALGALRGEGLETVMMIAGPGMRRMASASPILDEILSRLDPLAGPGYRPTPASAERPPTFDRLIESQGGVGERTDWAERSYFALPNNSNAGAIRLNLEGREANGRVPASEYDAALDRLEVALAKIEDVTTGEPLVERFSRPQRALTGAFAVELPDLFVDWNPMADTGRVRSPDIGEIAWAPEWVRTGDHSTDGLMIGAGSALAGHFETAPVYPMAIGDCLAALVRGSEDSP